MSIKNTTNDLIFILLVSALAGVFISNPINNQAEAKNHPIVNVKFPDLSTWPKTSQALAQNLMEKYGMPGEFTQSMLIWKNNGVWKKTVLFKDEVRHNFPASHYDVLEQTVRYRIPGDKFNALSAFDGSLSANRTDGTLTVRCMNESLNILALNLANEIVKNKKAVGEARITFYKNAIELMSGHTSAYSQNLFFENEVNAADPR